MTSIEPSTVIRQYLSSMSCDGVTGSGVLRTDVAGRGRLTGLLDVHPFTVHNIHDPQLGRNTLRLLRFHLPLAFEASLKPHLSKEARIRNAPKTGVYI